MGASSAFNANEIQLANIRDTLAQTNERNVLNQQRIQQLMMNQDAFRNHQEYQAALKAASLAEQAQGPAAGMATPTSALAPNMAVPQQVTSIASDKSAASDPNMTMLSQLQADKKRALSNIKLSQMYGQKPDIWVTELGRVDTQMRQAVADIAKTKAENAKEVAQIINGVSSPEGADAAVRHIADVFGPNEAMGLYKKLQVGPQGEVLWNDANKNVLAQYGKQYTSAHEQATQQNQALTYGLNVRKEEEAQRHNRQTELHGDQVVVTSQAAITASNARNAARIAAQKERQAVWLEQTGMKMEGQRTKEDQARIDQLAKQYNIVNYQRTDEVAARAEAQLLDPTKGYQSINPVQARVLVEQAKLAMENYRSRGGGKYQESEIARMNGVLQRMEKWTTTIGEGDKLLAKNEMLNLAREMRTLYADTNADLLRSELGVVQNTNNKGGNASWLNLQSNMENAIASGRAKKVTVNGKEYLAVGRPGQKVTANDLFELPSVPAGRAGKYLLPPQDVTSGE